MNGMQTVQSINDDDDARLNNCLLQKPKIAYRHVCRAYVVRVFE